ncbi:MAG: TPM domain-containing protein, partial [Desulfuromonadales bacterium]|nr:TPM domain-containing protein [Desulfuromonadales bacterium]
MKRLLLALTALLLATTYGEALEVPSPAGYVNDRAALLTVQSRQQLESFLRDFQASDSTQIVVLTIPSLEGEAVEEYALKVAEAWGIGEKGKDNGALLLVAQAERKIRIEVGYGLEGRLTDLLAGRIVDQEIAPRFREGDFNGGIVAGVTAMAEAVRGEYQGKPRRQRERNPLGLLALLLFLGPGLMLLGGGGRARQSHHRRGGTWIGGPFGG